MESLIKSILFATAARGGESFPIGTECTAATTCDNSNPCVIRFGTNDTDVYADYLLDDGVDGSVIDPSTATCQLAGATADNTDCSADPLLTDGCFASVSYCIKNGVCTPLPTAGLPCVVGGLCAVVDSTLLQCFKVTDHVAASDITASGVCGLLVCR
eukprot:GHVH01015133.1.p1 GENE.GHVH01015133.1~~GHVH01015133.1.p1  ORF type:complete len:157 (+),score=7.83 GHVH01015133.1:139-609(+)